MNKAKQGTKAEIEWKRELERRSLLVTRCSPSGFARSGCYDLHATDANGHSSLWEIKSTASRVKYFSQKELMRLRQMLVLAERHKMGAFVAVRFPGVLDPFTVVTTKKVLKDRKVRSPEVRS